jgi:hypothetical protein
MRSGGNRVWQAKLLTGNAGRYRQAGSFFKAKGKDKVLGE